jgi:hypothetical protein
MNTEPFLVDFQTFSSVDLGSLTIYQLVDKLFFNINRVFVTYDTPINVIRGHHAHFHTEMILVSLKGNIIVNTETKTLKNSFSLNKPNIGLYIPRMCWHTMQYSDDSIQLVIASTLYDEKDYIRDYNYFKHLCSV